MEKSKLKIKRLTKKDFPKAMKILDNELGKKRARNSEFLNKKFKSFPKFFIGIFLEDELIGVICGFPREDYLLMSEIAIDSRFQGRGFGKRLVKAFEVIAKKDYKQINVGALDVSIPFYKSLNYQPFLLVQFKKREYSKEDFKEFKIIKYGQGIIEIAVKNCNVELLRKLRKKYPQANFQYIFSKNF
jgi:GNAT superfamily N-acetyltransferase